MVEGLSNFLAGYSDEIQALTLQVRDLVLEVYPTAIEQVDPPSRIIAYGKDRTYQGLICAIAPQRKYVNLMFARGTELADAKGGYQGPLQRAWAGDHACENGVARPGVRTLL